MKSSTDAPPRATDSSQPLSLFLALLPVLTMLVCFTIGALYLHIGANLLILVMLTAATVAGLIAVRRGASWDDIQRVTGAKLASVLPAILILLAIGLLIGTWMLSGTIPMLVSYGLRIIDPDALVVTAFLVTCVMSLCTGTSWGSAGTIGVALMGMANALGAPLAPIAGAVVSGAYFGDKLSPLSDSTNICAIGAGADLYRHIRIMLYTAVPSFVVAAVVYATLGAFHGNGGNGLPDSAHRLLGEIDRVYHINLWTLLPPALVVAGVLARKPPVLVMVTSSVSAMFIGVAVQGFHLKDAFDAAVQGFDVRMVESLGLDPTELGGGFAKLLNRGGLNSMAPTLLVILAAFLLAAGMDVSGGLDRIINAMLRAVRGVFGLVSATMASGALMIGLTSHGGVTALVIGGLFQKAFHEQGLAPENLSRSLEDSVTIVEPVMPWTVSAMFMATTLGVPTLDYLPWATFCWTGPLFSLSLAAAFRRTGFGLKRLPRGQES